MHLAKNKLVKIIFKILEALDKGGIRNEEKTLIYLVALGNGYYCSWMQQGNK